MTSNEIYPHEYDDLDVSTLTDPQVKGYVEGYAAALSDLMRVLTGDSPCGKIYDPMQVEGLVMHSYAFDMKDGGRHHNASDYKDLGDIKTSLLDDASDWIRQDLFFGDMDWTQE